MMAVDEQKEKKIAEKLTELKEKETKLGLLAKNL
jgi:hypothetical protein